MITKFFNGKIFTSNGGNLYADAMIVEDGYIKWIGLEKDCPADMEFDAAVDFEGKTVIPGIVDSHTHPLMLAQNSVQISCLPPSVNSIEELKGEIAKARQGLVPGMVKSGDTPWILGWGYDEGMFAERRSPNRYDLDEGCADYPVSMLRSCAHIKCVNSKALEMAGITKDTPDPEGGEIERDENGEPTGVLKENACNLIAGFMPKYTDEENVSLISALGENMLTYGIVAISDMGNLSDTGSDVFDYYEAAREKRLKQEIAVYYFWDKIRDNAETYLKEERFSPDNQIHVAGLKLIGDGSYSGHTAWVDEPYLGTTDDYGICVCNEELLDSAIEYCKEHGLQASIHGMGARTIDLITEHLEKAGVWDAGSAPHARLEHITEPSDWAMEKAKELGLYYVTQPIFLYSEINSYLTNLGAERTKKTYPVVTLLERGVNLALSTDSPATSWGIPYEPFTNLKAAVTRYSYNGVDLGQDQRLDLETALQLYTRESAKACGFEKLGQLSEGYKASFAVLDRDIFDIPGETLDETKVDATYVLGEAVYTR